MLHAAVPKNHLNSQQVEGSEAAEAEHEVLITLHTFRFEGSWQ